MAMSAAFPHPDALQSLLALFILLGVLIADAEGRHHVHDCPEFSCGHLRNVSSPFRRQGDPSLCGVQSYELVCTDTDATIRIGSGTYKVLSINYTGSYFWVVDANMSMQRTCPLPRWDYHDYRHGKSHRRIELASFSSPAIFVNCSQRIEDDVNGIYNPVACLSTNSSFIYMVTYDMYRFGYGYSYGSISAGKLKPSCGYLAGTFLGGPGMMVPQDATYEHLVNFMREGFTLRFPFTIANPVPNHIRECIERSLRYGFRDEPRNIKGAMYRILDILVLEVEIVWCVIDQLSPTNNGVIPALFVFIKTIPLAMWFLKMIHVLCRFILMPIAAIVFLAYKYWKNRVTIDAVEKFLRMQQLLVPTRYAYTDIIAITNHFREKLGQGGYGSVYRGMLLPGNVHVAIKMLGNSNCNGEEFISEVATIGKIHHVNVVRLIGFCSEEMRRALVYEYMPNGSLDKYIFSSKKSFSWDKLNEIALGIAKGINYLHVGCDMQIVHFDIKPHNILLDNNFVPKVADFGLAKLFPRDNSFLPLSAMRGTIGYIAPEMVSRSFGVVSSKSDVYSFGMLLLEMAGGRRNADPHAGSSSQSYYPSLVYNQLSQQEDVGDIGERVDMHDLEKNLCIVGLWCIQMRPQDRPTMSEVIEMLETGVDGLQMPPRPFFCDDEVDGSYYMPSELNAIQEEGE
ncbi:hypothetical protein U9M48_020513 [Paspalum notatum var. saurae]|uniref:Protein kinase domain-containing protein n=1 Tax=Paspalum notatum var. saurae TaxID=547442 RepID=A0AAQ3TIC4_PASNO